MTGQGLKKGAPRTGDMPPLFQAHLFQSRDSRFARPARNDHER